MATLDEYRGVNRWAGLIPAVKEPRIWDEGFRSFLVKYGMLTQVAYDVFIKGGIGDKDVQGLRGTSRFKDDSETFTKEGLQFSYINKARERKQEYDFTDDYHVIGNLVCSPHSILHIENNWFGFVALSNDLKELIIVLRGTQTSSEWVSNVNVFMEPLEGSASSGNFIRDRFKPMVHVGFQELYHKQSVQGVESPKDTIHRLIAAHRGTLDKVTVVGHSLGGAVAQMCAVELAQTMVLGDVPILCITWAAPKLGNRFLANWVQKQEKLRILRVTVPVDIVNDLPPNGLWGWFSGYTHMGTEIALSNAHLHEQGIVQDKVVPNHSLGMYLHNIDPTRDVALMNKAGNVLPEDYANKHDISPMWHSQTWPRTIYHK